MTTKHTVALLLAGIFVIGAGSIIYRGRPVMTLPAQPTPAVQQDTTASKPIVDPTVSEDSKPTTKTQPTPTAQPTSPASTVPATEASGTQPGVYTLATVKAHATRSDCWSVVNGSVYDLTDWVNRHPGGAERIIRMCGRDASTDFNRQHGRSKSVQATLVLFKIGSLQ